MIQWHERSAANLRRECDHAETHGTTLGICAGCGKDMGWRCPRNARGFCEYDDDRDPAHDSCLFCGDPEERK
jgi:hypothetical protein